MSNINFPYASLDAAIKDGFKRLQTEKMDGPSKAFSLLVFGFKQQEWHRAANERQKEKKKMTGERMKELERKIAEYERTHPGSAQAARR